MSVELLSTLELVDHHCHGVVTAELDRAGVESMMSEGGPPPAGVTHFDTPLGLAVRRHCAPALDLPAHAPAEEYLARRAELGTAEVTRRLVGAAGTREFLVDTGFGAAALTTPAELAAAAGPDARGRAVVRLESVAEALADGGVDAAGFRETFGAALAEAVAETGAVGVKSVAAYRCGLELGDRPPAAATLATAVEHWLTAGPGPGGFRVTDPVIETALVWAAIEQTLPVQFHVGYGDRDITLHRTDPSLLTPLLRYAPTDVPVLLLHCYPHHRAASYLAAVFEQVYLDVGLTLNYVGPTRATPILAEALDLTPFGKMLYSSDAFGLPEFYLLGALTFRRALGELLGERVASGEWAAADAERVARMIGTENARRVYRLGTDGEGQA